MINEVNLDQTTFQHEEPLFEQPVDPRDASTQTKKAKKFNLKTIGIIATVVLFFALIVVVFLVKPKPQQQAVDATPTPTPSQNQAISPLDQLFNELDTTLQEADPTKNILSFPPLSDELFITPQ